MRVTLAAVICALLFAVATASQELPWREITIESKHAGMEASRDLRLVIESQNGVIVSGKHRVNAQLVDGRRGASATFGAQPTLYRGRGRHPRAELDDSDGKRLQEKITAAEFRVTSG
jgi:hypothetical protein